MATTTGLSGSSINTQFFTSSELTTTVSSYLENPIFTGTADFRNVTSYDGFTPFPSGTNVGGGFPIFSAVVIDDSSYDYRFRSVQSTSDVIVATVGPSVTLSLNPSSPFNNPTITGVMTANSVSVAGSATSDGLTTGGTANVTAGNYSGIALEKLDVAVDAGPGDLLVADGTDYVRLPGGANGTQLFADPSAPTGLSWQSPTVDVPAIVSGATAGSLIVSNSSTPTYVFFPPPSSSGTPRFLRRNPATSSPFLSWETFSTQSLGSTETVVVGSLTVSAMTDGLFYSRNVGSWSVPRIKATSLYALGTTNETSTATILASPATNAPILLNNVSFIDGAYNMNDTRVSPTPAQVHTFTVSDTAGIFPGRTWTFACVRLRPGRIFVGDNGSTGYNPGGYILLLLKNESSIQSTSPGTTTLSFTIPTLPTAFQPYFDTAALSSGNPIPYTAAIGLEPALLTRFNWPYMRWNTPTSLNLYLPSLATANTINVPTSGIAYLAANA